MRHAAALRMLAAIAALASLGGARSFGEDEAARLSNRAAQDRDIVYSLHDPGAHSFLLHHDYTESREGMDHYVNVVRKGSTSSRPSAVLLDTGDSLETRTLRGEEISKAKVDIGEPVKPDSEAVVVRFPPVKKGRTVRIRITETYTDPKSFRLEGDELVFDRSFGRPRNTVILPGGWYLTASSIPATVSETEDGRIRLVFVNGRPDEIAVLLRARRRLDTSKAAPAR
ncbi:MAG: hypothetical protein ABI682_07295 [Acidobacteriota bacterium]